jgi:hypothetical protein
MTCLIVASRTLLATTWYATSVAEPDVEAAKLLAANGDTVVIPAGTATWTSQFNVTQGITLQGAGVGRTVIKDAVQTGRLLVVTLAPDQTTRVTGIEFQDGGRINTARGPSGLMNFTGSNLDGRRLRIDHCKFNDLNGVIVTNNVIGVFDHDTFIDSAQGRSRLYPYNNQWNGRQFADGSWADLSNFGSDQFLFIEDCSFINLRNSVSAAMDGHAGARLVVRYNYFYNKNVQWHGTETGGGRSRGARAVEIYNNRFEGTNLSSIVGFGRSGVVLFHDNTVTGFQANPHFALRCYRTFYPFQPWLGADGTNVWDKNDPSGPLFTGTAASDSVGQTVTVSANPSWTTNQWLGYSIIRTTNLRGLHTIRFGTILSNTSNTITYTDNGGYTRQGSSLAFAAGDTLKIYRVIHALDQPGRSGGSLVTGRRPSSPWAPGQNDQVTEPCYSWNNLQGNFRVNFTTHHPVIRANEHYFNDTAKPGYKPYTYPHPLAEPRTATRTSTAGPGVTPSATPTYTTKVAPRRPSKRATGDHRRRKSGARRSAADRLTH